MTTHTTWTCPTCNECGRELIELDPFSQDDTCDTPPSCCLDQIKATLYKSSKGGNGREILL